MHVLCLDLSINQPGYCIADTDTDEILDIGHLTNKSREPLYSRIDKNLKFFQQLTHEYQIKAVWLERPAYSKRQESHSMLVEQQGIIKHWFYTQNIPVYGLAIKDIKKHVTGDGSASKEKIIQVIKSKGYAVKNSDEADAISIYLTGIEKPFLEQINL